MKRVVHFLKEEVVLTITLMLAFVSAFFVKPDRSYTEYIDYRVLAILAGLMLVMEGLKEQGVFRRIAKWMISKCKDLRAVYVTQVFLCFFFSMWITNDVALIVFVPLALETLCMMDKEEEAIHMIVFQTLAANLGSMLTPVGNPQNLYLYGLAGYSFTGFVKTMLPLSLISAILLWISCVAFGTKDKVVLAHKEKVPHEKKEEGNTLSGLHGKMLVIWYGILFLFNLLAVLNTVPYIYTIACTVLAVFLMDRKILIKIDYGLLLTFAAFFIFVGNMGRIPSLAAFLERSIAGRELGITVLLSQGISNVPAALLLSGFTDDYSGLNDKISGG